MNSSDLNKFFLDDLRSKELQILIAEDVKNYSLLIDKKGSSIPLNFYEDEDMFIDTKDIERLLLEILSGNLSNIDLAYICDCITLGEKVQFANQNIEDVIFNTADPEINGGYKSNEELKEILGSLY